jgi:hypothetical protein
VPVLRMARAAQAAIGRHWALLMQGFFADGVVFPLAAPGRAQALVVVWMISEKQRLQTDPRSPTREAPSALRPASTSASAYLKSD